MSETKTTRVSTKRNGNVFVTKFEHQKGDRKWNSYAISKSYKNGEETKYTRALDWSNLWELRDLLNSLHADLSAVKETEEAK